MTTDTSEVLLARQTSRKISKAGRQAMAEAGARNLAGWRAKARTRASDLDAEVNAYRDALLRDVGASPTATKLGLVEAVVSTYAGILKVRHALVNSRKSDVATLTERVSWLASNLTRLLRFLNLDARPRPRFLGDTGLPKVEQTSGIERSTPAIPASKLAEASRIEEKS